MSLSDEDRAIMVNLQMEKALKNLEQADGVYKLNFFDLAANRYYYACFHAIQALLIANGLSCHTHAGTITEFGKRFIKPGFIPAVFGKLVSKLEQLRETGDYNCAYNVEEDEISSMIQPAHEFVALIKDYLKA